MSLIGEGKHKSIKIIVVQGVSAFIVKKKKSRKSTSSK